MKKILIFTSIVLIAFLMWFLIDRLYLDPEQNVDESNKTVESNNIDWVEYKHDYVSPVLDVSLELSHPKNIFIHENFVRSGISTRNHFVLSETENRPGPEPLIHIYWAYWLSSGNATYDCIDYLSNNGVEKKNLEVELFEAGEYEGVLVNNDKDKYACVSVPNFDIQFIVRNSNLSKSLGDYFEPIVKTIKISSYGDLRGTLNDDNTYSFTEKQDRYQLNYPGNWKYIEHRCPNDGRCGMATFFEIVPIEQSEVGTTDQLQIMKYPREYTDNETEAFSRIHSYYNSEFDINNYSSEEVSIGNKKGIVFRTNVDLPDYVVASEEAFVVVNREDVIIIIGKGATYLEIDRLLKSMIFAAN